MVTRFSSRTSWDASESNYAAAVREVRASGLLVISLNMAGSVPDAADLVAATASEPASGTNPSVAPSSEGPGTAQALG